MALKAKYHERVALALYQMALNKNIRPQNRMNLRWEAKRFRVLAKYAAERGNQGEPSAETLELLGKKLGMTPAQVSEYLHRDPGD